MIVVTVELSPSRVWLFVSMVSYVLWELSCVGFFGYTLVYLRGLPSRIQMLPDIIASSVSLPYVQVVQPNERSVSSAMLETGSAGVKLDGKALYSVDGANHVPTLLYTTFKGSDRFDSEWV